MVKYTLSQNISITAISDYGIEGVPEKFHADHFVLYHEIKKREYLINPSVKYFLDKFTTPHDLSEVISSVKEELSTDLPEVEVVCNEFFEFLVSKKIIVEEGAIEKPAEKSSTLDEGELVNFQIIQNLISNRKEVALYKVFDPASNEDRVLKILMESKTKNENEFKNETGWLEREFALLKRVEHIPEMCKAYSFEKNDEFAYIQLEYIEGESLKEFLNHAEGLLLDEAVALLRSIISPFALMHQSDLIHGDIHSSNILINKNMEVKIIDLGFSSLAELEKNQLMKSGGVPFYMPPERINLTSLEKYKSSSATLRSDVYQVGLLMFLTVYRSLPFDGFIWEELAENIQTADINFAGLSFSGYAVPENLISIMKKCLDRDPNNRYENAAFILNEFNYHFYPKKNLL